MSDKCPNHHMAMVSSEIVWKNKYDEKYGRPPIKQVVTFTCSCCQQTRTIEFKERLSWLF